MKTKPNVRFSDGDFRKSSFSHGGKKVCVQVAIKRGGVAVRDSKDPTKTTLYFTPAEWRAFTAGVKADEFNN
ncbi:MAG: DUF397 domain-containing protein [Candidatus Niyogibacteria bacterium]|nr:DUF397 domain-containing protein [Candidatus Niyogibacteria bacterium]